MVPAPDALLVRVAPKTHNPLSHCTIAKAPRQKCLARMQSIAPRRHAHLSKQRRQEAKGENPGGRVGVNQSWRNTGAKRDTQKKETKRGKCLTGTVSGASCCAGVRLRAWCKFPPLNCACTAQVVSEGRWRRQAAVRYVREGGSINATRKGLEGHADRGAVVPCTGRVSNP